MNGLLLDTNALVALLWPSHARHELTLNWFRAHRAQGWATCPLTEAGFIRIVSNPSFSRDAVKPREALQLLAANTVAKDHLFWQDDLPFAETVEYSGVRLLGHQQVTDSYLLGLVLRRGGILVTLDNGVIELTEPKSAERKAIEVVR